MMRLVRLLPLLSVTPVPDALEITGTPKRSQAAT
jgi:hypothetical protein